MNVNEEESKNKKDDFFNESYKINYHLQFFYIDLLHYNWESRP
jgi:hypothetical protein